MCGAARGASGDDLDIGGLSPRVWGSPIDAAQTAINAGSIPTCVGQPVQTSGSQHVYEVYPHVCGAALYNDGWTIPRIGLSPRVWGSLVGRKQRDHPKRSIPTCVGQPEARIERLEITPVYPHVCGAALFRHHAKRGWFGLSPRVWGSLPDCVLAIGGDGSIPTCVGQPISFLQTTWIIGVYPHVCGAAGTLMTPTPQHQGLSPRVWGSPMAISVAKIGVGSIPTCVGQPVCVRHLICFSWVYPHVCGAAYVGICSRDKTEGLSPRVWGSHYLRHPPAALQGSIPTCVGQPCLATRSGNCRRVYPHVCGAAPDADEAGSNAEGLSPRVWGSPVKVRGRLGIQRSIPTCVGQPEMVNPCCPPTEVYPHVCGAAKRPRSSW